MHRDHKTFEDAIHSMNRVTLCFFSKEDGTPLTRTCAPMDFGPSRRAKDQSDRYHFWDYDSDTVRHTLSLLPGQIISIERTEHRFQPAEFISWNVAISPWFLKRDWGAFS